MILVDTSVWIAHFRTGSDRLRELLQEGLVLTHPWVVGELACGSLRNRAEILSLMRTLPHAIVADDLEVLDLLERRRIFGKGIGWVDAHLLTSALLARTTLWTMDRALARVAWNVGVGDAATGTR